MFRALYSLLLFATLQAAAQGTPPYVVVVNGGLYEFAAPYADYVRVGILNTVTRQYTYAADTIKGQSVTDGIVVGDTLYVSTDIGITGYTLPDLQRFASTATTTGIRKLAYANGKVWATRGYGTGTGQAYLYGFDGRTLARTDTVNGLGGECEHILAINGSLYIGVPYSYLSNVGALATVDPESHNVQITPLGRYGKGMGKIIARLSGAYLGLYAYAQGGSNATDTSYTIRFTPTATPGIFDVTTFQAPVHGGYGVYARPATFGDDGAFFIGQSGVSDFATYLVTSTGFQYRPYATISDEIAGMDMGQIDAASATQQLYTSSASYSSAGYLRIYALTATSQTLADSIQVGISPEVVKVYYPTTTAIAKSDKNQALHLWPNPAQNLLHVEGSPLNAGAKMDVITSTGALLQLEIQTNKTTDVSTLPPGVYTLTAKDQLGLVHRFRFVKQ